MEKNITLIRQFPAEKHIVAGGKIISFFKNSFLLPFIFSSLLYILMRIFFIGSVFSNDESLELYIKTFLVTWSYINAWRMICYIFIWIESKTTKLKLSKFAALPALRKTAIFIIIAGLAYGVNACPAIKHGKDPVTMKHDTTEIDPRFYLWMK